MWGTWTPDTVQTCLHFNVIILVLLYSWCGIMKKDQSKLTECSFKTNGEVCDDTIENGLGENVRYLHKTLSCCIWNWSIHSCGFLSVENCSFNWNDWLYRWSVTNSKKQTSRVKSSHYSDQILWGSPLGTNVPENGPQYNRSDRCEDQSNEIVFWTSPVDKVLFPEAE